MAETKRMTAEQVVGYLLDVRGSTSCAKRWRWLVREADGGGGRGADRRQADERPEERTTQRNGYRARPGTREWGAGAGDPEAAHGVVLPELAGAAAAGGAGVGGGGGRGLRAGRLHPQGRAALVQALGLAGLSKSEVSRLCGALDEQVGRVPHAAAGRGRYPYLWLDAKVGSTKGAYGSRELDIVLAKYHASL